MILVDSNIILDIVTQNKDWYNWSSETLQQYADSHTLVINKVIYTEVSNGFDNIEDLNQVFNSKFFKLEELPLEACFLAGKIFLQYKKNTGTKTSTLPDFFIGAHAAVKEYPIITRDIKRYNTYYPTVALVTPTKH